MKIKRILAYAIDIIIVNIIASLIFMLPIFENDYQTYTEKTEEYTNYILNIGSGELDYDIELDYAYTITQSSQPLLIITSGLLILYFGVFAYFFKGQTLGKKITKLKVVSIDKDKLNPNLFMIRAIILTNLLPKIASIISIMYLSKSKWIIAENIIAQISNLILFIIIGFMIFRDDERGLHDVICKTKVIDTK